MPVPTPIIARSGNFLGGTLLGFILAMNATSTYAAPGDSITTPANPTELPVEIEVETGVASLKQAPLWKELVQMLEDPYLAPVAGSAAGASGVVRRPGFGVSMPPLNVWPLGYNFLTAQPMRIKTSDAEVNWDVPGPLFDPDEVVPVSMLATDPNVPLIARTKIGALVACSDGSPPPGFQQGGNPCGQVEDLADDLGVSAEVPNGWLVVHNPSGGNVRSGYGYSCDADSPGNSCQPDSRIPSNGTVVAVPALIDGVLYEAEIVAGEFELEPVLELEAPVNEEHFIEDRLAAEELGKALFWDMQVGSDGVQACGSCHFHAGADNRTKNQLNPNHIAQVPDHELQVFSARAVPPADPQDNNQDVIASDFPFHKLVDPDEPGEPGFNPGNVVSDVNDVMSSMGVSRFAQFQDVVVGPAGFGPPTEGVAPLLPDEANFAVLDPIPLMQGLRRVEPRNTPTMHAAAFNLDNFWDGRAKFEFNGGSVFGPTDPFFHIFVDSAAGLAEMSNPTEEQLESEDISTWTGGDEPPRIKFSSLSSQAVGPPLSDFEMAFAGRNWPKIGKKLLQDGVTPLANQLVATNDSRLGRWSNQGGSQCLALGRPTAAGKPGLCTTYPEMIMAAFGSALWDNASHHLAGAAVAMDNGCEPGEMIELDMTPTCDPFDGYVLEIAAGAADPVDTNQFTQMEANFSLFFALSVQAYETLLIPDDTPFDRFMDANPLAGNGVGQPGEQGVLFPTLIPDLVRTEGPCPAGTYRNGALCLVADDPSTPEYDGFQEAELVGFDMFAGSNLTAALAVGNDLNPQGFGANPFTRTARCMLCHLGPEQTDHSINIGHGLIKGDAEFEFPTPPVVPDPGAPDNCAFEDCLLPAPEPPGVIAAVGGLVLTEEVEESPQDAVEVEPINFNRTGNTLDKTIAAPSAFAFGDQGIYNVGLRPDAEDIGRGGDDPFGWPLARVALTLKNVGGADYQLCDHPADAAAHPTNCNMTNFDPDLGAGGGLFEETTSDQSINPGLEREPIMPLLPEYIAEWTNALPAGELHPQIDEQAGFAPNTITAPNGGPAIEFPENLFGADLHCGLYDPVTFGAGSPNFGWGPSCPNNQSGAPTNLPVENNPVGSAYVPGSLVAPVHGTWPFANRLRRDGQFKAPQLRNVELTGPYFHTGSYLTLRQVVDFYLRGGDFPATNAESRDQHMVDTSLQVFSFGSSLIEGNRGGTIPVVPYGDALPDTASQYDAMPDTLHPVTPEPAFMTREFAAVSLVKYLLSLTDPRVSYRRAPFDQPEIFVPVDGTAPENTGGRPQLLGDARFLQIVETGSPGQPNKLPNFLGIASTPDAGPDHFDR